MSSLSSETIRIVKSTAPVLAEHGYAITRLMYERMLQGNSNVKEMFNPTHQIELPGDKFAKQPFSLACSVHAYAANIDNLSALTEAVERISQKHVSLNVRPEQYKVVKENLFGAMKEVLKDALTPEVGNAWSEAYDFLAQVLIDRESRVREEKSAERGGWEGFRRFEIVEKNEESAEITSFVLKPEDRKPLMNFEPGNYVAIRVNGPNGRTVRNYSLSSAPRGESYRISVKKTPPLADAAPPGHVSNFLHDSAQVGQMLELSVPCGDFFLKVKDEKPVVLISGGVGITPIFSMFEFLCRNPVQNQVVMINYFRDPKVEALSDEISELSTGLTNLSVNKFYYTKEGTPVFPGTEEMMEQISSCLGSRDAHFYFCGSSTFMKKLNEGLKNWGVPKEQIYFEFFGPSE